MKRNVLIFLISLLTLFSADAQRADLIYGNEKNSDVLGMYKLKILKNGNTAQIGIEEKAGFFCTLYDTNKKKIIHTVVPSEYKPGQMIMKAVFELNNEVVVMIQVYAKPGPILTRYTFDGSTGQLKKQDLVATMPIVKASSIINGGRIDMPDFFVQKDVNSDNYAVVCFDSFSKDMNTVIEVFHYNSKHQIITRAYLPIPEIKYTHFRYTDIYVNGASSVIIASYLFYKKGDDEDACFYLSELKAGQATFKSKRSVESKRYFYGEAIFMYNKVAQNVKFVAVIGLSDAKGKFAGYSTISQTLNVETLALSNSLNLYSNKVNEKYQSFVPDRGYGGMVENLCVDSKGNTIVLSEMMTVYTSTDNDSRSMEGENIGISCISPMGKEQYGELVYYKHIQLLRRISFVYTKVQNGQYQYPLMDEFDGSYVGLIPGKINNYVFLNNTIAQSEKNATKDATYNNSVRPSKEYFTSYIYTLNATGIASREFVFGKPTSPTENKYCLFNTADYNPETGMYAVIVIDKIGRNKTAGVVWMNLK